MFVFKPHSIIICLSVVQPSNKEKRPYLSRLRYGDHSHRISAYNKTESYGLFPDWKVAVYCRKGTVLSEVTDRLHIVNGTRFDSPGIALLLLWCGWFVTMIPFLSGWCQTKDGQVSERDRILCHCNQWSFFLLLHLLESKRVRRRVNHQGSIVRPLHSLQKRSGWTPVEKFHFSLRDCNYCSCRSSVEFLGR